LTDKVHVFTSCAYNYFPKIRLLFNSIKKYHPEWSIHLILADKRSQDFYIDNEILDEVVFIEDLNIPNYKAWIFDHNIVELSTAIKPFMFERLMSQADCKKVIFLDPDIVLFSRLDDIVQELDTFNMVLIPHQASPEISMEGIIDNEIGSLKYGVFNLGFLGVANTKVGRDFIQWWSKRIYHFCKDDIPNGLFTDQKWINLAPVLFDGVRINRSTRHDVANWNMPIRKLTKSKIGNYLVDGNPLGFYHFTGFDSGDHLVMLKKYNSYQGAVKDLYDWYSAEVKASMNNRFTEKKWGYSTYSDGVEIKEEHRELYRNRKDLQEAFLDPFDAGTFKLWLDQTYPRELSQKKASLFIPSQSTLQDWAFIKKTYLYIKNDLLRFLSAIKEKLKKYS
jgi:hypothetical protein